MDRRLNTEDYLKAEKEFWDKNKEYYDKIVEINREENKLANEKKLTQEKEDEFEKRRNTIKEEYGIYSSIYNADFYCLITKENIDKLINRYHQEETTYKWVIESLDKYVGKEVQDEYDHKIHGVCNGIALFIHEIYFIIDNKHFALLVEPYKKENHESYNMVTTNDDKGYL